MWIGVRPALAVGIMTLVAASCASGSSDTPPATSTLAPSEDPTTVATTSISSTAAPATTEEIRFSVASFDIVGDLHLPAGPGPHGAVVLVHGSGPQTRTSTPTTYSTVEIFRDAGYAVLVWDKPGSGESTGEFSEEYRQTERATILAAGIEALTARDDIDRSRVGVWGLSEAGWVMPIALTMTDDIGFMVVVSGGAEDSIENMVYRWGRRAVCGGRSEAEADMIERYGAMALKATDYDEFREALETARGIPNLSRYVGVEIEVPTEDDWAPWPREIDAFLDPIELLKGTSIPILAIYGERDIQVDPRQGAEAYRAAFERSGHPHSAVEVIPGVGHILTPVGENGCTDTGSGYASEYFEILESWLEDLASGS
jgi:pimeloyl-ACP methyl ester carboxylesterase